MGPHHNRADAWAGRAAPMPPIGGKVELWTAAFLRAHPPDAPARGTSARTAPCGVRAIGAARMLTVMACARSASSIVRPVMTAAPCICRMRRSVVVVAERIVRTRPTLIVGSCFTLGSQSRHSKNTRDGEKKRLHYTPSCCFLGRAPSSKIMRQNKEIAGAISGPRRLIPDAVRNPRRLGNGLLPLPTSRGRWARFALPTLRPRRGRARLLGGLVQRLDACEIFLGFQCRHAAHARGGHRLAIDVVGHVTGGVDTGNVVRGRVRR